jgi:UDP-glucose 4-epimerase
MLQAIGNPSIRDLPRAITTLFAGAARIAYRTLGPALANHIRHHVKVLRADARTRACRCGHRMILILGAGFLGGALHARLRLEGRETRIFSRTPLPHIPDLICGDINHLDAHAEMFRDVHTIIYTIHTTVPASAHGNPYYDTESNVLPLVKFLDVIRHRGVRRLIYVSTGGAIYGNPTDDRAFTERSVPRPVSAYGVSKLAMEQHFLIARPTFPDGVVILRPSNIYGRGQRLDRRQGVVAHLLHCASTGAEFELWGDGLGLKDYLYLEDFTNALLRILALEGAPAHNIFNLSSSKRYSVWDIIREVQRLTCRQIRVRHVEAKDFDVRSFALDSTLFSTTFGWAARYDLRAGLTAMAGE